MFTRYVKPFNNISRILAQQLSDLHREQQQPTPDQQLIAQMRLLALARFSSRTMPLLYALRVGEVMDAAVSEVAAMVPEYRYSIVHDQPVADMAGDITANYKDLSYTHLLDLAPHWHYSSKIALTAFSHISTAAKAAMVDMAATAAEIFLWEHGCSSDVMRQLPEPVRPASNFPWRARRRRPCRRVSSQHGQHRVLPSGGGAHAASLRKLAG